MILQLIYEKVLKNRTAGVLEANTSKFQNGGAKGKCVTDNLFISRGAIDHARYLGKEVFIIFYDIEKRFDSLWLQDCINAFWDNGIQDDSLYFIYLTNCFLDRNPKEGSGYQMGLANIKSLEFVDDITDLNRNFSSLYHSNKLFENIQHEKD